MVYLISGMMPNYCIYAKEIRFMNRIAKFEKVSLDQFSADLQPCYAAPDAYGQIRLPVRATAGSAGYDVVSPVAFSLAPGESIRIASGLRCRIAEGWVMLMMPKSGLGTKFRTQLDNTVGVIDSDYYNAKNEGHILIALTNDSKSGKNLEIPAGKAIVQMVFVPFGITEDDEAEGERLGGFGSTGV